MDVSRRKRISRTLRGKMRARVLSRYGTGILANTRNGLLIVDPRDFNVSRALLDHGAYDWSEIEWLGQILDSRSRLVFVGAHIGALLVPLALRSGSRQVVALEPSPRNHELLTLNLALNGLEGIELHRIAAGNTSARLRFEENPINTGNSRVTESGSLEVETRPLDAVLSSAPYIDLMIMDTEGFEVQAMQGGAATLARTRYFYVEFAPAQLREQGSQPAQFIRLAAEHYSSMYLPGDTVQFFAQHSFIQYLESLPERRGLLLNLLFSNEPTAHPKLMEYRRG